MIINGPYTKGVFRKSCNVKLAKEIHQKLDEGLDCVDEETPTLVVGHLLKVRPNQSIHLINSDQFLKFFFSSLTGISLTIGIVFFRNTSGIYLIVCCMRNFMRTG